MWNLLKRALPLILTVSSSLSRRELLAPKATTLFIQNFTDQKSTVATKRKVPTIASLADFENELNGYLSDIHYLALLLDYDGTLAKIAQDPRNTTMTEDYRNILKSIAKHPKVSMTVISGRGLKDVQKRVGIPGIWYAGNHGLEIESSQGRRYDYNLPADIRKDYMALVKELTLKAAKHGAWVENKLVSLSYHYRDVPPDMQEQLKCVATEIISKHGFCPSPAKHAIEAKPNVNWRKGEASLLILSEQFGNDFAERAKIIFAGDDTTDEDAMQALQGIGKSFRISEDPEIETYGDYRLPCQEVVFDMLTWIRNVYQNEAKNC